MYTSFPASFVLLDSIQEGNWANVRIEGIIAFLLPNGKKVWRQELGKQQPDGDRMVVFGMGRCPDNRAFKKWAVEACGSLGEGVVKDAFFAAPGGRSRGFGSIVFHAEADGKSLAGALPCPCAATDLDFAALGIQGSAWGFVADLFTPDVAVPLRGHT